MLNKIKAHLLSTLKSRVEGCQLVYLRKWQQAVIDYKKRLEKLKGGAKTIRKWIHT